MRYMLLIYMKETDRESLPAEERRKILESHVALMDEAIKRDILVAVSPLARTSAATTVRVDQGKVLTTDGPFAETKEQLAGYYILDCENLDEAIAWAARIPARCQGMEGCVEIRPLQALPAFPDSFRKSKAASASVFKEE
jgi:hypothetical protein